MQGQPDGLAYLAEQIGEAPDVLVDDATREHVRRYRSICSILINLVHYVHQRGGDYDDRTILRIRISNAGF